MQMHSSQTSELTTKRLQELEQEGFIRRIASPHGRNNCLIDSLMLCLSVANDIPQELTDNPEKRQRLANLCPCQADK